MATPLLDDPNNPNGGILDMELLSDFLAGIPPHSFSSPKPSSGLRAIRTNPLPPGLNAEKADASFKNGVLTIRKPHSPESKSKMKRIEVKSA